ncbi:hypothetical protein AVW11_15530 [Streptomyces amritsarensis]|uniref:Lipoprotein n=1 Tax=Streptomyces amritsarensis TaxID=681158 RepID=A0ABX3G2D9_9ACTN|nr:hypothetical protein [Streptomyces amritsarensis]OLZ66523.1 hypothetical protein AVW11_15530 [Streptomyces amritsarensis]
MRSSRRTTLRTAAVVVAGAATVLALPAGSAFADAPTGGMEQPSAQPPVKPSLKPSGDPKQRPLPAPAVRAFVTAVKLADGSVAKVYTLGRSHFEADIFAGPTRLDTLVSRGAAASYGRSNGLHVVLQPNGTVASWLDGGPQPKPRVTPKPRTAAEGRVEVESSVRVAVPGGRIAKLVDGPRGKYVVISMPNGRVLGTVDLKRPSVRNGGWTYELVRDGKRVQFVVIDGKGGGNGWVYDFGGSLIGTYTVDAAPQPKKEHGIRVVPSGGARAASGPAGLGFAVVPARG